MVAVGFAAAVAAVDAALPAFFPTAVVGAAAGVAGVAGVAGLEAVLDGGAGAAG